MKINEMNFYKMTINSPKSVLMWSIMFWECNYFDIFVTVKSNLNNRTWKIIQSQKLAEVCLNAILAPVTIPMWARIVPEEHWWTPSTTIPSCWKGWNRKQTTSPGTKPSAPSSRKSSSIAWENRNFGSKILTWERINLHVKVVQLLRKSSSTLT